MSFYMRYELSRLIREEEAKTFAGVQRDTGRAVFLHLIAEGPGGTPTSALAELIRQAERTGSIIDTGDFAGTRYVVTEPIEPFHGLRTWLQQTIDRSSAKNPLRAPTPAPERRSAPPPPIRIPEPVRPRSEPPPISSRPQTPPAGAGPSEFTLLFGNKQQKNEPRKETRGQAPVDDFDAYFSAGGKGAPSAPTTPPAGKAGEFTSLFGSGESPAKSIPPRPSARPAPDSPPPSSSSLPGARTPAPPSRPGTAPSMPSWRPQTPDTGIGEFDRVFNPPAPAPKPEPPPAGKDEPLWPEYDTKPAPSDKPNAAEGNFTRFFGGAIPGEQIDIAAEQAKNAGVRDDTAPFQAAGGFTRVFGPEPGAKAPPPPPPPARSSTGNMRASQLFSFDAPFMHRDPEAEKPPEQKAVQNSVGAEPGEYTKMINLGGDVESSPTAPLQPAAPAPSRAAAPLSQAMPAIMTAEKRGKRILRTVLIVLGAAGALGVLFVIILLVLKHFATPR